MKVEWQAQDIIPGQRYGKDGLNEVWMIGYLASGCGQCKFVSISTSDGMVTDPFTPAQLASQLTRDEYLPVEVLGKHR